MPETTLTLTDFLLARITEDEVSLIAQSGPDFGQFWDRMSHETKAKRRIVEIHARVKIPVSYVVCPSCSAKHAADPHPATFHCGYCGSDCQFDDYLGPLLALPYADHPDYRDEWRP